jgi:hypothetical protein
MRAAPNLRVQKYRQPDPNTGIVYSTDNEAWFLIPYQGQTLKVIVSEGLGWDHVSVSHRSRCPTWLEMVFIRDLFFRDDETVIQFHVPRADHINVHPYCLHLWRPQSMEIPRPPKEMVG